MALTPEDVVNKRFQSTKFREGYDQDEVDDFLDEIVIELRRLNQENEELRQRLTAADARVSELQSAAPAAAPAPAAFVPAAPAAVAPAVVPAPVAAPEPAVPSLGIDDPSGTNNLLQLARRLHEEHVREGVAKRDALIAEGEARAAQIIVEAEERGRSTIASLEGRISTLDAERISLERSVDELRAFERDYRTSLKSFIEAQLRELDGGAAAAESAPAHQAAATSSTGEAPSAPVYSTGEAPAFAPPAAPVADANPFPGFGAPQQQPYGSAPQQPAAPFQGFGSN